MKGEGPLPPHQEFSQIRIHLGLNHADFGYILGVSEEVVVQMEDGDANIPVRILRYHRDLKALGVVGPEGS